MLLKTLGTLLAYCLLFSQTLSAANVGFLIMATGKYIQFVPPLIASAEKHFCKNHKVTYFVYTDGTLPAAGNTVCIYQKRLGWPLDTMNRYHAYAASRELLATQDYLFASDADMLFVDTVGDEILGNRVATLHPGFFNKSRQHYSYDTNPLCTACIGDDEGDHYFAGGFYGGTATEVLKMLDTNVANIDRDLAKGIIAVWHDESHWNRYCIDHPPTVILDPSYCYPESWDLPYHKRLLALDKNHSQMRAEDSPLTH